MTNGNSYKIKDDEMSAILFCINEVLKQIQKKDKPEYLKGVYRPRLKRLHNKLQEEFFKN